MGLLHGLPVSLKEQFHIKGKPLDMGYVRDIGKISQQNSVITDVMLNAGAVLYVRTSIPQSLMRCETHNHIYGRTVSPFNRSFTPGGSSGGEGALVGMHGSPSEWVQISVGLYAYLLRLTVCGACDRRCIAFPTKALLTRSSARRVSRPSSGLSRTRSKVWSPSCALCLRNDRGRWTRSSSACHSTKMRMRSRTSSSNRVALSPPKAYTVGKTQLCFAIEWDDGIVHPHPPITRALREVKEKLLAAGHKVIDWVPYDHLRCYDIIGRIYSAMVAKTSDEAVRKAVNRLCTI